MDIEWIILVCILAVGFIIFLTSAICYFMVFYSKDRKPRAEDDYDLPPGKEYEPFYPEMVEWTKRSRATPHKKVEITTFDGHYTFRVFSAYPTDKYDKYFRTYFSTDEEFVSFLNEREAKSLYHRDDISFTKDDIIITLSTCILGNEDGRYAIHAKLIKVEK